MTWLETRIVVPPSAMARKVRHSSSRVTGSRPTVGSSMTSSSGLATSAQAKFTRLASPPE